MSISKLSYFYRVGKKIFPNTRRHKKVKKKWKKVEKYEIFWCWFVYAIFKTFKSSIEVRLFFSWKLFIRSTPPYQTYLQPLCYRTNRYNRVWGLPTWITHRQRDVLVQVHFFSISLEQVTLQFLLKLNISKHVDTIGDI